VDCLVLRTSSHDDLISVSRYSRCPVINGLTNYAHPCQALADVMTMEQIFSGLSGLRVAYVGDANNVAFSLGLLSCKLGMEFRIAAPTGYRFSPEQVSLVEKHAARQGLFRQHELAADAVREADVVYTDVWTSMGQESEEQARRLAFRDYQVNRELFELADPKACFMHCLPARRGEEVTAEVIDGPRSATILQAENRMHAQKGLVVWLLTESQQGA
jgi:ornithine carbamoyltransferase